MTYEHADNISKTISQSLLAFNSFNIDTIYHSMNSAAAINTNVMRDSIAQMVKVNRSAMEEAIANMSKVNASAMNITMTPIPAVNIEAIQQSISRMSELNTLAMQSSTDNMVKMNIEAINRSIESMNVINLINFENLFSQLSSIVSGLQKASLFKPYDILQEVYRKNRIDTSNLITALNKYQWFILPRMPSNFITEIMRLSTMDSPRRRINKHFYNFFADNNFENLNVLVDKWDDSGKFRPGRLKVMKDSLNVMINAENGRIPSTLIVPSLIAQIDGIQREFLLKNNFKIAWTKFKYEGKGKSMNQNEAWEHIYSPTDDFSSIINDIILDVLFGSVNPGEPIKTPITFSRHKIMHGEHLNYGTKPNTIRTFIILDFLHDLL